MFRKQRSVPPQEDLCVQFYGISFMHPYKQSGGWQNVFDKSRPISCAETSVTNLRPETSQDSQDDKIMVTKVEEEGK